MLGYVVDLLSDHDLEVAELSEYDVIICGIRAFNVRDDLERLQKRLIEFIDSEWGEFFSENIDSEPIKYKHDLIESLWG